MSRELLQEVFAKLGRSELFVCLLTCKDWNGVAIPELYYSIEGHDGQGILLARTVAEHPWLG